MPRLFARRACHSPGLSAQFASYLRLMPLSKTNMQAKCYAAEDHLVCRITVRTLE